MNIYTYAYIYISTHKHTYTYIYIYIYIYIYVCIHVYIAVCICTYVYIYIYRYVYFKTYAWWKGPSTPPSLSSSLVSCESCRVSLVRMVSHAMSLLTLDRCPVYHPECAAVCCSVLQCVAVCCRQVPCLPSRVCCSVL